MAMMIREDCSSAKSEVQWNYAEPKINLTEGLQQSNDTIDPESLIVTIEAIHQFPFSTNNFTRYHKEALKGSAPTWNKPYSKPVILHHNEEDGKTIGRVLSAEYITKDTLSGTPALDLIVNIPDEEAKKQIKNGILKTTSIGIIAHDCRCSICGQNIAVEGPCEHEKGLIYDGETCYWDIYSMTAKELSFVIVPSDMYSQIKNYRVAKTFDQQNKNIRESLKKGVLSVSEQHANINNQTQDESTIDYKAKYEEMVKKYEELETKKGANDELATKLETITQELNNTKVLLDQAQKSLQNAERDLVLKEAEVLKNVKLRESLEEDLSNREKELKESLLSSVSILRHTLNKPAISEENLQTRSCDSLRDSINDLKEEMNMNTKGIVNLAESNQNNTINNESIKEGLEKTEKPENPGLVAEKEKKPTAIKEAENNSNINLEESLKDVMSSFLKY